MSFCTVSFGALCFAFAFFYVQGCFPMCTLNLVDSYCVDSVIFNILLHRRTGKQQIMNLCPNHGVLIWHHYHGEFSVVEGDSAGMHQLSLVDLYI